MKKYIISILASGVAAMACAQGLNKEITIEKEIVPEQRAATRLPVNHSLLTPKVTRTSPSFSSRGINAGISPELHLLDPASTDDLLTPSPYRGYLSLGYFPSYNLGASAGYRFIDDDETLLGGWAQFNGFSYDRTPVTAVDAAKTKVSDNSFRAGVDFYRRFGESSHLSAGIDFGFGKSMVEVTDKVNRSATQFHLNVDWQSAAGELTYKIGVAGGYFGNSLPEATLFKPFSQSSYGGSVGVGYSGLTLDLSALMTGYSRDGGTDDIDNPGMVSINPAYTYRGGNVMVRLGVKGDLSINSGKSFRVAPDVRLEYRPDPVFAFYVAADGGLKVNTMESIYEISHFVSPAFIYGNSFVPFDLRGGIVIGPFRGGSLELFGGYAKADDWLMTGYEAMTVRDVKGWHCGARLAYDYRSLVKFKGSVEMAPSSDDKAYYLWRDRAKTVVNLSVEANPIDKLTLEAGWELRSGRNLGYAGSSEENDLGTVSNLRFGAAYRVSQPFTVFARGENLLNNEWDLEGWLPANGVCGLIGISYKF